MPQKHIKSSSGWAKVYEEIAANNLKYLNWCAMNYFVKRQQWGKAAKCRDRIVSWNKIESL